VPQIVEIALFTQKVIELTDFYERLLGQPPDVDVKGMSEFSLGGLTLRIHVADISRPSPSKRPDGNNFPSNEDHFAFGVEDLNDAARSARERGIVFEVEPTDFDWGRSAYLRDPDGRLVELSQLRESGGGRGA
jgi:catechol 2,3-dioxygenase-like lactoylglutathione lyase family enzyme